MRNTLVILNYQREIPPFMQNLIHFADGLFDRIIYFTPELYNDNREACNSKKLRVIQCDRSKWRKALLKSPKICVSKPVREQIDKAVEKGQNKVDVYKQIIRHSVCADTLMQGLRPFVLHGDIKPHETIVLSAWFSTEAYAAAKLKKEFPDFMTASFAHSFEINRDQNPIVMFDMNIQKHGGIDALIFISSRMRKIYKKELSLLYPDIEDHNWQTRYLGSNKRFPGMISKMSEDGKLRIVSCSSVVEVKRIQLIIGVLAAWQGEKEICWTHIGGGPLFDKMKQLADERLTSKKNVSFVFTDAYTNEAVQKFYVSNPVDIFINVSAIEGLPVSLMECMSYGIPAIATEVGGTSEIVSEETGYLVPRDFSAQDIINVLTTYCGLDSEIKSKMRKKCSMIWEEKFNAEKNTISMFNWMKSVK